MEQETFGPPLSVWQSVAHMMTELFDFIMQYGGFGLLLIASLALNWWLLTTLSTFLKDLLPMLAVIKDKLDVH